MALRIKITVDNTTRTEACDQTICLKDNIDHLGIKSVAAGLLGVQVGDIKRAERTGNCKGCKFEKFVCKNERGS